MSSRETFIRLAMLVAVALVGYMGLQAFSQEDRDIILASIVGLVVGITVIHDLFGRRNPPPKQQTRFVEIPARKRQ